MEASIKLEDIIPENPTFKVAKKHATVTLRNVTVQDQAWLQARFPDSTLADALTKPLWAKVAMVAYRLMDQDSREKFPATELKGRDEEGRISMVEVTGPEHLMAALSAEEGRAMLKALLSAFANGNPLVRQAASAAIEEVKKKSLESGEATTGRRSSISSRANTAGRSSRSSASRSGRS